MCRIVNSIGSLKAPVSYSYSTTICGTCGDSLGLSWDSSVPHPAAPGRFFFFAPLLEELRADSVAQVNGNVGKESVTFGKRYGSVAFLMNDSPSPIPGPGFEFRLPDAGRPLGRFNYS